VQSEPTFDAGKRTVVSVPTVATERSGGEAAYDRLRDIPDGRVRLAGEIDEGNEFDGRRFCQKSAEAWFNQALHATPRDSREIVRSCRIDRRVCQRRTGGCCTAAATKTKTIWQQVTAAILRVVGVRGRDRPRSDVHQCLSPDAQAVELHCKRAFDLDVQ
jgi:hypothetical protein